MQDNDALPLMSACSRVRSFLIDISFVSIGTMVSLSILLKIWTFHPRIPIIYDGDGLLMLSAFRNFQDTQWYFNSNLVGYPYGQYLQDFPAIADGFCLALSWMLVKALRDPIVAFNIFFLLTYPITAIGGYVGSRMVGLRRLTSGIIGVLFTFLPFHALHGAGHTYLVMYPVIPIVIGCTVRQIRASEQAIPEMKNGLFTRNNWTYLALGLFASISGLYYAFFSAIVFAFGCLLIFLNSRKFRSTLPLLLSLSATCLGVVLQALPILWFQHQNGPNLTVVARTKAEVEYYSLRLIDLFLPRPDHILSSFAKFTQNNRSQYIPGEQTSYLGLLGALGVLILIIGLIATSRTWFEKSGVSLISKIFLLFLLISVLGGVNQILASLGFTQIRVWSRTSILIGFLALVALGHVMEAISTRLGLKPFSIGMVSLVLVCLGIADTNRLTDDDKYTELSIAWHNDKSVVRAIETEFGEGARVLQIPILKFPEQGTVFQLPDYSQLRGQLHSDSLCWSYGAVMGRDNNRTLRWKQLQIDEVINEARIQGFDALWLERRGYQDFGVQISKELEAILGPYMLQDRLKTVEIFDLREKTDFQRADCQ